MECELGYGKEEVGSAKLSVIYVIQGFVKEGMSWVAVA